MAPTVQPPAGLLTISELAKRMKVSMHRVRYAVNEYHIDPVARVGIIRLWSEEQLPTIRAALSRIAGNGGGGRL